MAKRRVRTRQDPLKRALRKKLAALPDFEVHNHDMWIELRNHMVKFGQRPEAELTERWARLMQGEIAIGWAVGEIALPTLHEANYGTIPNMASLTVIATLLHQNWREDGDALLMWFTDYAKLN